MYGLTASLIDDTCKWLQGCAASRQHLCEFPETRISVNGILTVQRNTSQTRCSNVVPRQTG